MNIQLSLSPFISLASYSFLQIKQPAFPATTLNYNTRIDGLSLTIYKGRCIRNVIVTCSTITLSDKSSKYLTIQYLHQ